MKLRPAVSNDIPILVSISKLVFAQDPLYARLFPRRSEYPDHFHHYLLHDYKRMLATPGQLIVCAELQPSEKSFNDSKGTSNVVGFATFVRSGTAAELARWNADSLSKSM